MTKIIQPLRIYSATSQQLVNRHTLLDYNLIVPLLSLSTSLPAFCITSDKTGIAHPLLTSCVAVRRGPGTRTELIPYLDFSFAWDNPTSPTKQYIFHAGQSTIPALKYGVYYLEITDGTNTWYSEYFKVGNYSQTVTIDFTHSANFGGLWFTSDPYKARYISYTFDPGDFDEYTESHKDDDAFEVFTYQRINKLRGFFVMGDSNVVDCLKLASICDTVYVTDELGTRERVKISSVTFEPVKRSNYVVVSVKYSIYGDDLITVNTNEATNVYDQDGTAVVEVSGGLTFDGEDVYFNNELLTP